MRTIVQTSQFKAELSSLPAQTKLMPFGYKQDLKKIKHSGRYKIDDLLAVVESLANGKPLADKHRAHDLAGNWQTHKECHIKPDWLLIYQLPDDKLILVRTGSHSELF